MWPCTRYIKTRNCSNSSRFNGTWLNVSAYIVNVEALLKTLTTTPALKRSTILSELHLIRKNSVVTSGVKHLFLHSWLGPFRMLGSLRVTSGFSIVNRRSQSMRRRISNSAVSASIFYFWNTSVQVFGWICRHKNRVATIGCVLHWTRAKRR